MQLAAYIGVYGLTLAALLIFPAPGGTDRCPQARHTRLWTPLAFVPGGACGSYAFGLQRIPETAGVADGVRVRIVQPNIPQREKWKPENRQWIFDRVLSLTKNGTSGEDVSAFTHVIWPESSVPFHFGFNRDIYLAQARDILAAVIPPHTTFILGAERAEGLITVEGRYTFNTVYNSLFVLSEGAQISGIYDKIHLVPFGEYVPFREIMATLGLHAFSHRLSGFEVGPGAGSPDSHPQGARLSSPDLL